jgi:short-subunit dehydrogenase
MAYEWKDKVVLVTGASSGIGRALALEWGRRGARVAALARRAEALIEVAGEVERAGGRALALPADVRDAAAVEKAVARVLELWGGVDVLVANAGMTSTTGATSLQAGEASDVISVNVIGVINSVAAVLPSMLERKGGHLVAISSLASYRGMPKSGAYSASKAAVSTFFESMRVDLRRSGIVVTTIHPGFIRTPLVEGRKAKLPFLMEVEPAARLIVRAVERRARTYAFPWQLAGVVKLIKHMPDVLYDRFASKRSFRD